MTGHWNQWCTESYSGLGMKELTELIKDGCSDGDCSSHQSIRLVSRSLPTGALQLPAKCSARALSLLRKGPSVQICVVSFQSGFLFDLYSMACTHLFKPKLIYRYSSV